VKAAKASLGRALDRPDPAIRYYLFHGADDAGGRALAVRLLNGLGSAEKFILLGAAVKADPASLADEAGALSLFGGRRALWIEPAGDEIVEGVAALLDAPASESAVIAIAGPLRKTSELLKLAERHPAALAHCSYIPDSREIERIVIDLGSAAGLHISPDVAQRIAAAANSNQAIAASEITKFALFVDADPARPKALDHDVLDLLAADSAEADLMRIGDLALAGQIDALTDALARLPSGGSEGVAIVRALQRRLLMLAPLRARVERGETINGVLTSMGKALFWKDKALVDRLIGRWSAARLAEAAERAAQLEDSLMGSRAPGLAALGETLITLARVAARGR
jgi:DNA polymerase-3 subunit delta